MGSCQETARCIYTEDHILTAPITAAKLLNRSWKARPLLSRGSTYPEREMRGPAVRLEANRPALLEDGLVGCMQAFPHHGEGVVISSVLVIVSLLVCTVLIFFLVSQQIGMKIPV